MIRGGHAIEWSRECPDVVFNLIRNCEVRVMGRRSVHARRVKPRSGIGFIQQLESRQLLATLNVVDYGAIPNDNGDDRNAIVAAINASNNGDTIYFPVGVYRLSKEIGTNNGDVKKPLGRGRIYKGETTFVTTPYGIDFNGNPKQAGETFQVFDRTVLLSTGQDPDQANKKNSIFNFRETNPNPNTFNAKFTNLTFRGRGFNLATNNGAMVEGLIIDNCHFDVTGGGQNNGIEFTTGLRNVTITNNIFHLGGSNGIYGYNWDNLNISNNWFINPPGQSGTEAVHIIAHIYSSPNLLMEQNYFRGIRRMAIETQGGGVNTIIRDNWYEDPFLFTDTTIPPGQPGNPTNDTFGYSIINDRANGVVITRNVAIMPTKAQSPLNNYVRIVYEIGGLNVNMYDNYSDGGNHVIAGNGAGATGIAHDNKIFNFSEGPRNSNGSRIQYVNNNQSVALSFNPFTRLRPQPNIRYGETPGGPTGGPAAPTGLTASGAGSTQINLNWSDQAINETSYRVERRIAPNTWITEAILGVDATSYTVTGLSAGLTYAFRVFAVNAQGDSAASNIAEATTSTADKPATPTNLVGTTVGLNQIDLTWTDNATNETGYRVERLSEDGVTWVVLTPELLPVNSNSYSLTSLASGRTFQFRVIAVNGNANEESDPSNIAVVQTPLADAGTVPTPTRRARPAFYYTGSTGIAVGPNVTGAS